MNIDWCAVATIVSAFVAAIVSAWATRKFERRPVLLSYFSHISAFTVSRGAQPFAINTHTVVLRNAGRLSATNVRLRHAQLPDFNIWPAIVHRVETLPNNSKDIVIPTLVPGEEIMVSYLYSPPLTVAGVNAGIKSDHGFAQAIPVLLQRQYPLWVQRTSGGLLLVGAITLVYVAYRVVRAITG